MTTKELTASDICKIIISCKKSGVVELKFKDLCINFSLNYNTEEITRTYPASTTGFMQTAGLSDKPEDLEARRIAALDELMLSNPMAYEEALNADSPSRADS